jgi:hypothetical protein
MKIFSEEFDKFKGMLEGGVNFAFTRFSDGELFIMQNKEVQLAEQHFITGDTQGFGIYPPEEQKHFVPEEHAFYKDKLVEAFQYKHESYYIGLSSRKDVGDEDFEWQLDLRGSKDETKLTFANVLINNNYKRYVTEVVPMFNDRDILFVANERADFSRLPFKRNIRKDFRIGSNCMINDYGKVEEVKSYIEDNNIEDHIILCGAASLSNYITHECFKDNQRNTFLDIGSTLNPLLGKGMNGWVHTRGYLTSFWLNSGDRYGTQIDEW